jgi:hypothetical protein
MAGSRQIKQIGLTRIGDQADAAAMPVEISKGHRVERGAFRPIPHMMNRDRSVHFPAQYKK